MRRRISSHRDASHQFFARKEQARCDTLLSGWSITKENRRFSRHICHGCGDKVVSCEKTIEGGDDENGRATFAKQKLSENFIDKVIAELLSKPKPLENPEHPLRKVWEAVQVILPDYTIVEPCAEIEPVQDNYNLMGDSLDKDNNVFHVDSERMLRVHTTTALVNQLRKYKPPIKLLTAGRVFRQCEENTTHYPVFHQVEGLCVGEDVTKEQLKETIRQLVHRICGDVKIRFRPANFPFTDPDWEADVKIKGNWREILGVGMFRKRILQEAGFNPEKVSGFGFGMGIERLAMIKYEIIRTFWRE
jgi:phenylalanyl-tRNA synthetase alpha chain